MKYSFLQLYQSLPGPMRSVVASFRGFYLRSWRYGPETEQLVEQALEREYWPAEKWTQWQQDRLGNVLHRAATKVPYYREYWSSLRRSGNPMSWELLENWPTLEKRCVQDNPRAFVAEDADTKHMFREHTSGTTGR